MSKHDEIRKQVAEAYGKAVKRKDGSGCCAPSCCGSDDAGRGKEEDKSAGMGGSAYDETELGSVPADAASRSFGSGNPVRGAELSEGQTVVDLGSGAGLDLLLSAQRVGPTGQVIGVDMTDAMIERARAAIAASGLSQAEVRKGLIEELPVGSATADRVISNCVINLSPDKPRVFSEIARVLRPGGRFSISDMVVEDLPEPLRGLPGLRATCAGGAIPEHEYVAGLRAAGLVDVEVVERNVFSREQIRTFLDSEEVAALGAQVGLLDLEALADALTGKVWSARFTGRRPEEQRAHAPSPDIG